MTASPSPPDDAPGRRWRARFFPSLGARLVGLFLVLACAVAVTFLFGVHALQYGGWREYVHPLVMNYADMLVAEIGSPPDVERARTLAQHLPLHIRIEGPSVNWDSADEPRTELPPRGRPFLDLPPPGDQPPPLPGRRAVVTLPDGEPIPLILPGPRRAMRSPSSASDAESGVRSERPPGRRPPPHRLLPRTDIDPSGAHIVRRLPDGHRIIIGLADASHEERTEHIGWVTLALLLLLTGFAYVVVRHMLHPLVALRAGAVRYGQGDFSQPIVPRNRDELGDLAEQINAMAARLHHMLDAKRQLLLAISHELRSPLTRARMNAELVEESGERSALLRDLGEMRDLITDLLESERLADVHAGGHAALQTEATTLSELVQAQCGVQAEAGAVVLRLDDTLPALALDRTRMRLLLRNLVDNALRHGGKGPGLPPPEISTSRGADGLLHLVVRDHGTGMDAAQLAHAGEAFYRADAARLRSTGGVGLGLYLCKLVAEAHGGRLALRNAEPGLEVDVALPLPTMPSPAGP